MDAETTSRDKQSNSAFSFLLQLPQGISFELTVDRGMYSFYLNETVVEQIQQAQKVGHSLYIPPRLLVPLWYYTCFNDNITNSMKPGNTKKWFPPFYLRLIVNILSLFLNKSLQEKTTFQSGLTFNSYYRDCSTLPPNQKQDVCVLQSNVLFDGDIIHKVRRDFLKNPDCFLIVSTHHWLTDQLLSNLRSNLNQLAWEVASLVPAASLTGELYQVENQVDTIVINHVLSLFELVGGVVTTGVLLFIFVIFTFYWFVAQLQKSFATRLSWLDLLELGIIVIFPIILTILTLTQPAGLLVIFTVIGITTALIAIRYVLFNKLLQSTFINLRDINKVTWYLTNLSTAIAILFTPHITTNPHFIIFLFLLLLSLFKPLLIKNFFRFLLQQIGRYTMRWLLSS
ncbi:hypothetical protein NUACC21_16570 [Scytonema sp. NUACC21]